MAIRIFPMACADEATGVEFLTRTNTNFSGGMSGPPTSLTRGPGKDSVDSKEVGKSRERYTAQGWSFQFETVAYIQ